MILTQNEVVEFVVTLQNPYIFDLELEEISLRSDYLVSVSIRVDFVCTAHQGPPFSQTPCVL